MQALRLEQRSGPAAEVIHGQVGPCQKAGDGVSTRNVKAQLTMLRGKNASHVPLRRREPVNAVRPCMTRQLFVTSMRPVS
jgi:hypothetical protein